MILLVIGHNDFPKGSCKLTFSWNRQLLISPGTRSWRYRFISWRFLGVYTAKFFHLQASFKLPSYYYSFPEVWHSAHSLGGLILALSLSQPLSFSHGQIQIMLSSCLTSLQWLITRNSCFKALPNYSNDRLF